MFVLNHTMMSKIYEIAVIHVHAKAKDNNISAQFSKNTQLLNIDDYDYLLETRVQIISWIVNMSSHVN